VTVQVTVAGELAGETKPVIDRLVADGVPARLAGKDATLWGPDAVSEAEVRLGWLDLPASSRDLVPRVAALREELAAEGLDHVVLAGMGGSSLAPEVITRTAGAPLTVLDTTDPGQVRAALADRLERTVVVVSSKSGGTVETDSHRRAYAQAFSEAGLSEEEIAGRFVVVTDPGSPLAEIAEERRVRALFLADPNVGGRYSALSAFGLVPAGLAGVDIATLLDDAAAAEATLGGVEGNPGLILGAALGAAWQTNHDKIVIADAGSDAAGFGDWAEQLLAESTGKLGKGLLPVVVEGLGAPGTTGEDVTLVALGEPSAGSAAGTEAAVAVSGPLGAQLLVWEYATAVAGRLIGINPFDQPNVAESKDNTRRILAEGLPRDTPELTEGPVEVYLPADLAGDLSAGAGDLPGLLRNLLAAIPEHGYLAVMAYLDRHADATAADLRASLASLTRHPVTFGWGPRFLHSTGQYHKGGPPTGTFLQITGALPGGPAGDLPVPDQPFSFGELQAAQAAGDLQALAARGYPAVRLHLTDRAAGIGQLLRAIR
jgi:glucose-6-phosphate isomerase